MQPKILKANCSFCSKEIDCPEDMMNAEKHACYECFKEREGELSQEGSKGVHVDIPADEIGPEMMTNSLVEAAFPKIWSEKKQELKEMSKRELAQEMFGAGAFIAISNMVKMAKKEENAKK